MKEIMKTNKYLPKFFELNFLTLFKVFICFKINYIFLYLQYIKLLYPFRIRDYCIAIINV